VIHLVFTHKLRNSTKTIDSKQFISAIGLQNSTNAFDCLSILTSQRTGIEVQTSWISVVTIAASVIDTTWKWNSPSWAQVVDKKRYFYQFFFSKGKSPALFTFEFRLLLELPRLEGDSIALVAINCYGW